MACGDNLTRPNIGKQAAAIRDSWYRRAAARRQGQHLGDRLRTALGERQPIALLKGETWERFGEVLSGDVGGGE